MTLQSSGQIAVSDIDAEIGKSNYSSDLNFLNSKIKPSLRPSTPNMGAFYGYTYFQNTTEGNCTNNGANCDYNCACDCGNNGNCAPYNCSNVNCTNCDDQAYLQPNCNCACTYNCNSNINCFSHACNCSKIICTKLHEIGLMPYDIFSADQKYGDWLRQNNPEVYDGYIRWAEIMTSWIDGNGPTVMFWIRDKAKRDAQQKITATNWSYRVATPWSEHMAYLVGAREKDNELGRAIMALGRPICKLVNKLPKSYNFGIIGSLLIYGVGSSTYYVANAYVKLKQLFRTKQVSKETVNARS